MTEENGPVDALVQSIFALNASDLEIVEKALVKAKANTHVHRLDLRDESGRGALIFGCDGCGKFLYVSSAISILEDHQDAIDKYLWRRRDR